MVFYIDAKNTNLIQILKKTHLSFCVIFDTYSALHSGDIESRAILLNKNSFVFSMFSFDNTCCSKNCLMFD